ncbi:MAG TPA: glycosyltransferase 87 family protein [Actinocrinis sp.]
MTAPSIGSRRFAATALTLAALSLALYVQQFDRQESYQFGNMVDLQVYRWGGTQVWHSTSNLYSEAFVMPFAYPPFAALVLALPSLLTLQNMQWAMSAASIAALGWVCWTSWGWLGYREPARRAGLAAATFAVALWLEPVQQNLGFGQVNLVLLAFALADLALPDRFRLKGIGVGLAASIKLTPVLFIVYLAVTRRFRAAAVASATFAATIAVSFAAIPTDAWKYWSGGLFQDSVDQSFMPNQSLHGAILRLNLASPTATHLLWDAAEAIVAVLGLYFAVRAHRRGDEYFAVMIVAFLSLLVSPISWTHHYVWMVPFLILAVHRCWLGGGARRVWIPLLLTGAFLAWPMRINTVGGYWDPHAPLLATGLIWFLPHRGTGSAQDLHWNDYQALAGNFYVFAALFIVIVLPAWQLWKERRAAATAPAKRPAPAQSATFSVF